MKWGKEEPKNATAWLKRAKDNLAFARQGKPSEEVGYEILCFQCQQAGEISLKAIIISNRSKYPFTHSLEFLIETLEKNKIIIPDDVKKAAISNTIYKDSCFPLVLPFVLGGEAATLTDHADTKYPIDWWPLNETAYKQALEKANIIVKWADECLKKQSDFLSNPMS